MKRSRTQAKSHLYIVALLGAAALVSLALFGCVQNASDNIKTADEVPSNPAPSSDSAGTTTNEPTGAPGKTIEMESYTVALPEPLASECEFVIGQESEAPGRTWVGDTVSALSQENGYALFFVACYSDDWGPQGRFYTKKLGASSTLENTSVYLCQAMLDQAGDDLPNKLDTYEAYVTLR